MFRQSPSRTQRSRGIKIKHVLQICFLLAICFWLLYQVKHSHDKKKEFGEGDEKISQQTQSVDEVLKLGRKDLNPRVEDTGTTTTRSQEEEPEEENAGEEEEEIKPEEEHAEDNKSEEKDDEQRGVGDDDIDGREEDKSDADVDREEDMIEEEKDKEEGDEKENEEKDSEDNDGQLENENSLDEHDDEEQAHEAREEHYKADDASSAVTHETEVTASENENGGLEKSDEPGGTNIVENQKVVNNTNENDVGDKATDSKVEDRKMTENDGPLKTTDNVDTESVGSTSDDSSSPLNSTLIETSNDSSSPLNSTLIETSNDHPGVVNNTTGANTVAQSLSMHNGTEKESDFSQAENVTTEGTASGGGSGQNTMAVGLGSNTSLSSTENQADDPNLTISQKVENSDNSEEVSKTHNGTLSTMPEKSLNSSTEAKDSSGSSTMNTDNATEAAKSEDSSNGGTDGTNDGGDLEKENLEELPHDLIDSSDSSIGLQEKDVRTDLETLPEIQTEGSNDEDAAAE